MNRPKQSLQNAVLITGAGQRIGLHLAKRLLQETDYPVVFTYRSRRAGVDELEALGATGLQVDFTQPDSIDDLLSWLEKQVASLRGVIHNASLWVTDQQITEQPSLQQALYDVHVSAPYQLNQQLQALLNACDEKADIMMMTDALGRGQQPGYIAYAASKAALQNMVPNFANAFAPTIKVNAIAPGLILFNEHDSDSYKRKRLAQSALGFEPGAEVIWQAVSYLLNSPYTTGTTLKVDGGKNLI